jgi:hypothetical protein
VEFEIEPFFLNNWHKYQTNCCLHKPLNQNRIKKSKAELWSYRRSSHSLSPSPTERNKNKKLSLGELI